jgi:2-dehydro-3-deoxyphosphogluconate aldolase/(4S)-4-hydroxy-2-oxoglutarate aldolase
MALHKRLDTLQTIKGVGLVPIFNHSDVTMAKAIVKACAEGGAPVVEFTHRVDRAGEIFRQLAELRDKEMPSLIVGAGSICNAPSAVMAISTGADFIVGPFLDEEIAKVCNSQKIPYMPGCGTVTEIHRAHLLGVEVCKVFPADCLGGPAFIKAIKAPCPWAELMATGGVSADQENLNEWFRAGVACVGMGSNLITKEVIQKRDFASLTEKVRRTIQMIQQARGAA